MIVRSSVSISFRSLFCLSASKERNETDVARFEVGRFDLGAKGRESDKGVGLITANGREECGRRRDGKVFGHRNEIIQANDFVDIARL